MMKALKKKRKGGFTLIELIVVIAILGILAAIAIPRLGGFTDSAKISADKATFSSLSSSIAIAVASGEFTGTSTGTASTVTVTSVASSADDKGSISIVTTNPAGVTLLESGAAFKLSDNMGRTLVWTIEDGEITNAPTIAEDTGIITDAS